MKKLTQYYLDENKNARFTDQPKLITQTSEELLKDYYERKVEEGGIFFGLDAGRYSTNLEDHRDEKYWRDNFDIDFRLAYGESPETMTSYVAHEPKSFARTLGTQTKTYHERPNGDKSLYGEAYTLYERGVIPIEIVNNTKWLAKKRTFKSPVPGTDFKSEHTLGDSWPVKGSYHADWYHFYVPMMSQNEGRLTASPVELEHMQQEAPAGAKMITEAPAALYISMTRNVLESFYDLALEKCAACFENGQERQERREFLEEYRFNDGYFGAKNVRMHIEDLTSALTLASDGQNNARLEVRPVFKFIRNEAGAEEELEIADSGLDYWIPRRLYDIYFNDVGQLRRNIQGYWDDSTDAIYFCTDTTAEDAGLPRKRLLWDFAYRLQGLHIVEPKEA